jgi:hypothetical protein
LNRRRVFAAVFFSVVIIAVLGVIVGAEIVSGGQTISVLRLRTAVQLGDVYSAADVDVVPLRIAPGDLNYETVGSVAVGARFALPLQAGDLLSPDELEPPGAEIEITLSIINPPPIQSGQSIDIFATVQESQVLIAHAVPVVGVSGGQLTVLVSSNDELAWVEIAASTAQLHAVVAVTSGPTGLPPANLQDAICELAPSDCGGLASSPPLTTPAPSGSAKPSASPSPTPTPSP